MGDVVVDLKEVKLKNKQCTRCLKILPLCEYHKQSDTSDGLRTRCKSCRNIERKKWRQENPDLDRAQRQRASSAYVLSGNKKKYYWDNRENLIEAKREYYANGGKEKQKLYQERTRSAQREYTSNRRARLKQATPSWSDRHEIKYIFKLAEERNLVVDHIVPLTSEYVCGLHTPDNLRCIPASLNCSKSNRYWPDMPQELNNAYT